MCNILFSKISTLECQYVPGHDVMVMIVRRLINSSQLKKKHNFVLIMCHKYVHKTLTLMNKLI